MAVDAPSFEFIPECIQVPVPRVVVLDNGEGNELETVLEFRLKNDRVEDGRDLGRRVPEGSAAKCSEN